MAVETATNISQLISSSPADTDQEAEGAAQLRVIKTAVKGTFPNVSATVNTTATELNLLVGITGNIQAQIDLKAPIASPTFTGIPRAPTASVGTSGTQLATVDFVNATSFSTNLPGQAGNAGGILVTDGTNASFQQVPAISLALMSLGVV